MKKENHTFENRTMTELIIFFAVLIGIILGIILTNQINTYTP